MKRQSSGSDTGNFKSQDALMQDKMKYELFLELGPDSVSRGQ